MYAMHSQVQNNMEQRFGLVHALGMPSPIDFRFCGFYGVYVYIILLTFVLSMLWHYVPSIQRGGVSAQEAYFEQCAWHVMVNSLLHHGAKYLSFVSKTHVNTSLSLSPCCSFGCMHTFHYIANIMLISPCYHVCISCRKWLTM